MKSDEAIALELMEKWQGTGGGMRRWQDQVDVSGQRTDQLQRDERDHARRRWRDIGAA
jgi:hypothetical protein